MVGTVVLKVSLSYYCFCYISYFLVDGGHRAVIFDRFAGVKPDVVGEGTHFIIPWVQRPIIFDIRSRPRNVPVVTGSKGKVTLFICFLLLLINLFFFFRFTKC